MALTPVTEAELDARPPLRRWAAWPCPSRPTPVSHTLSALVGAGLPADWLYDHQRDLAAVTIDEVQEASRRYLAPSALTTVVVGDADRVAGPAAGARPRRRGRTVEVTRAPATALAGATVPPAEPVDVSGAVPRAHDRAHLARALPDPAGGGPSGCSPSTASAPCRCTRTPAGPRLVWDEQPALPAGRGVPRRGRRRAFAAVRGERALTVSGRPVDRWAGLRELGADLGDLDAGLLAAGHRHPRVARAQPVQPADRRADDDRAGRLGAARPGHRRRASSRAPTRP